MRNTKTALLLWASLLTALPAHCWGFWAHKTINYYAVFGLPPGLLAFYKPHIRYLSEHAVDPDMRRYLVAGEGAHHYIDIDRYGAPPYEALPRRWDSARARYGADTLQAYGVVPWWVPLLHKRLTEAFKAGDAARILKLSAELGHYIADAHVPLHASRNHNGQLSGQEGIHGLWESRVPELLAPGRWNFVTGPAQYLERPDHFIWDRVVESGRAADTVLALERALGAEFKGQKWSWEERKGKLVRQYASAYARAYNDRLNGMVERRMRQSIYAVSCFWLTAWIDAGQPDLGKLAGKALSAEDEKEFEQLQAAWKSGVMKGRSED
ncbi:zinc dependent phospholipase C family protein [Flaviaesturariibacter aridisoli]|uniref:S1/P1 Nuclease n=1 Tax=Flaviaesturariibacter aridisoli TaxID=2545761 RepID=A0A4R4E0F7_9BACT|nr:zinc dependent phospholipase C family protein [Flaviaesturariibacter aridisoli]TCZ68840.1 S1/P1 Nuclease [Flaviaesturariibacter aridisoli]